MVQATDSPRNDQDAVDRYFRACHGRVDAFVSRHFRYPGAWHTNRLALGLDLLRAPVNLAWAPLYVAGQLGALVLGRTGLTSLAQRLANTPAGLPTAVQRHLEERIEDEILGLPRTAADRAAEEGPALSQQLTRQTLGHYASTRTATGDIANSLTSTLVGALTLKQFTPGGIAIGLVFAAWLAQSRASREFWLGETLGRFWYGLLPPEPGAGDTLIGIGATLVVLSSLASLSGLLLDPLQARLGLHQHRLRRMLAAIEADVRENAASRYRPRDPLLARVLDSIDALRSALPFS